MTHKVSCPIFGVPQGYRPAPSSGRSQITCYTSRLTRHSKRSEESRYQPLAAHWQVNTVGEKPPSGGHASMEYQFRHVPSSTPSPLRGPLLHGKACHWILRSLSLPYESSSFATLKGTQGRYGICFCVTSAAWRSAKAPYPAASPGAAFIYHFPLYEKSSRASLVLLLFISFLPAGPHQAAGFRGI